MSANTLSQCACNFCESCFVDPRVCYNVEEVPQLCVSDLKVCEDLVMDDSQKRSGSTFSMHALPFFACGLCHDRETSSYTLDLAPTQEMPRKLMCKSAGESTSEFIRRYMPKS
eukprot:1387670-Amphidinium_carterae.1